MLVIDPLTELILAITVDVTAALALSTDLSWPSFVHPLIRAVLEGMDSARIAHSHRSVFALLFRVGAGDWATEDGDTAGDGESEGLVD
jgi:hypothetical protein